MPWLPIGSMYEYGIKREQIAYVSVKSHKYGSMNPYARFQKIVRLEEVLGSRMISEPLTLLQCCAGCDGARALVIGSSPNGKPEVCLTASAVSAGIDTSDLRDITKSGLTTAIATIAYLQASIEPKDLDVVELHDAFSISELIYIEALGLCQQGEAPELMGKGHFDITGKVAVNPSGGLLSRGHPVGATGVAQLCELYWQLRGEAGLRQKPNARVGLTQTMGAV